MVAVTKPGLQRKRLFQAPLHLRHKHFSAPLSSELKKSRGFDALPLRKGDTVRIMRGDRKGVEGKVSKVDSRKYRVTVEGVTREKVDGTALPVLIHPSKVMIINLNLDDKWRRNILDRKKAKGEAAEKTEKAEEKTPEKEKPKKPRARKKTAEASKKTEKQATRRRGKKTEAEEEKETEGE
jgi:large subunit ribosomal protein L24